ncbi:hypothetical protein G7Y89_g8048 [Cudoniella acicularis]|uniref:Intradiol ring-cleavage dioxygenases domain-containing protein n=1 Tax=Cudoniella acicularis TaxID=354080 RepID=A0A8H4RI69_9HELO|nr:hypothetical protein G7Y89_g8048 [Cudoniella acicularis]
MSDEKRNEGQLMYDVIRLESLVDEITFKLAAETNDHPTASAILGPFWRYDAPVLENESTIVHGVDDGEITYIHGTVRDLKTREPVAGAWVDVWKLLKLLDKYPYRPAHIHIIVTREGYKPVTTQIFDSEDKYLDNDSVFAVKDSLVVEFKPLKDNPKVTRELDYPILIAPFDDKTT